MAATGCNWLQLAATGCNWLQLAATGCNWVFAATLFLMGTAALYWVCSVNPESTSNQSSKPCTVLQYPSRKVQLGVCRYTMIHLPLHHDVCV